MDSLQLVLLRLHRLWMKNKQKTTSSVNIKVILWFQGAPLAPVCDQTALDLPPSGWREERGHQFGVKGDVL